MRVAFGHRPRDQVPRFYSLFSLRSGELIQGARPEFEPGILALLQCSALRRPALPGLQSPDHDPERLQGPRCEMQHKRQRHFGFVTSSLVNMALAAFYFLAGIIAARAARLSGLDTLAVEHGR